MDGNNHPGTGPVGGRPRSLSESHEAVALVDNEGRVIEINVAFSRVFGYENEEIAGKLLDELVTPSDELREEAESLTAKVADGEFVAVESTRCRKDGTPIEVSILGTPIHADGGQVAVYAIYRDVTERKRSERALTRTRRQIERLHEVAHRLALCAAEDDAYRLTVEAAERILSFKYSALRIVEDGELALKAASESYADVVPLGHRLPLTEAGGIAAKTFLTRRTFVFGDLQRVSAARPVNDDYHSGMSVPIGELGVFQVVATSPDAFDEDDARLLDLLVRHTDSAIQRLRLQIELREQATHDALTGVCNRRYFNEVVEQEISRSRRYDHPLAFLMIDVNRFKEINDRFGHQTGDRVLREVATILESQVRDADSVVRYGGDEFLVVLPETDGESEVVAKRIQTAIEAWNAHSHLVDLDISLAIGDAHWRPDQSVPIERVLAEADRKMYVHKRLLASERDADPQ